MILSFLHTALTFALIFTILVFFHELGHFLAAKAFKMRVEEFGFGLPIPGTKRICRFAYDGETEYTIWPVLFGGFVRIAGMELETGEQTEPPVTTNIGLIEQETAEVSQAVPDGFNTRPIPQRFAVILAGPVFSFILGWVTLFSLALLVGLPDKALLGIREAKKDSIAYQAGLRPGDIIMGIGSKASTDFEETLTTIRTASGKPLMLHVKNEAGALRDIAVTPKLDKQPGETKAVGRIGIVPQEFPLSYKRYPLPDAATWATAKMGEFFVMMGKVFSSWTSVKDNVGGPVGIFRQTGEAAKSGPAYVMNELAMLSLSLGLFNLLPIPVLDGGHLFLMLLEAIRGRKLTADQTVRVLGTGMALLAFLTVVIFFKDVWGIFAK